MTKPNKYPVRHLSIRVPWHDNGWDGTVCKSPKHNGACLRLSRIVEQRDDQLERAVGGKSIETLRENMRPCCVAERVSIDGQWIGG